MNGLQRTVGNARAGHMIDLVRTPPVPMPQGTAGEINLSQPGDPDEREATAAAERVRSGRPATPGVFSPTIQAKRRASKTPLPPAASDVRAAMQDAGMPLSDAQRARFEPLLGRDLGQVRVHTGPRAAETARAVNARAFTAGQDIAFDSGEYVPGTPTGDQLLAHELTHVVQQQLNEGSALVQRQELIEVELITELDSYTNARTGVTSRVGDAHGQNILMKIEESGDRSVVFSWFNFFNGAPVQGRALDWEWLAAGDPFRPETARRFGALGRQLTAQQWRDLWPNPVPALLQMYEEGRIRADEEVIKSAYRGMVSDAARRQLDENDTRISTLLDRPDRIATLKEYAQGLREASIVRDELEARKARVDRALTLSQQQFHIGLPKRQAMAGLQLPERFRTIQEQAAITEALGFWFAAFPLLSRLSTSDITPSRVEVTLRRIQTNIRETRAALAGRSGREPELDPWDLENVRAGLQPGLGPRTRSIVEAEDRSRRKWAWIKGIALAAGGIALLFVPGGIFIDAAIGVAMTLKAWEEARIVGRAANTAEHVDEGLMAQGQALGARFNAILSTIFAVVGAAGATFRILRVGRAFALARRALPELGLLQRMRLARMFASEPEVIIRLGQLAARESHALPALREALAELASDPFRLRQAIRAIADGYRGPAGRAWMHGLHPDALAALQRASASELEEVSKLIRRNPQDAVDILRQFTYKGRKAARRGGLEFTGTPEVAARLRESIKILSEARGRGYPFGFRSLAAFRRFGQAVRDAARRYGVRAEDVRVHGSSLRSRTPADIDAAILVDKAEFDALARQFIREAEQNGFTKLARTIAHEATKGKIPYSRFAPREPGFAFGRIVRDAAEGRRVNVSLIVRGGEFDLGPFLAP